MVEVIHALNRLTWPGVAGLLIVGIVLMWAGVVLLRY